MSDERIRKSNKRTPSLNGAEPAKVVRTHFSEQKNDRRNNPDKPTTREAYKREGK